MKKLHPFSLGIGDRFAQEGEAQLQAFVDARAHGIDLVPVWNKSNREHTIVKSEPASVRREAENAVAALGWTQPWHVDADHINLTNVDRFIAASDFYTIDVADYAGQAAEPDAIAQFVADSTQLVGARYIPGLPAPLPIDRVTIEKTARKFLASMQEAGRIYRHIAGRKGADFIAEVSIDETDQPQTPAELLLILWMLAREKVPCQTVAPKFTGRFNKGVDYAGELAKFEREFDEDLGVVRFAIAEFGLPASLKLSVHSGSDKFSIYPAINRLLKAHGAGVHVKTAGTTWLEEVIGLAESGGDGLEIAREIYLTACARFEELVKPYAPVVEIDPARLPKRDEVKNWRSTDFCQALRHDPQCPSYNPHFRQFIHVSFRIAAEMGERYISALRSQRALVARNVTENLFHRHILPIFG